MNRPSQRELFASERPVRSDYAREPNYARRRLVTIAVLALIVGASIYALTGHKNPNSADIPTVKAEGVYKQKPADPGGIDIPHQDVMVYDQLEGKGGNASSQVEHLLPPPETPKEQPRPVAAPAPSVVPEPAAPVAAPAPAPAPVSAVSEPTNLLPNVDAKPVDTTVVKSVAPAPVPASAPAPTPAPTAAPVAAAPMVLPAAPVAKASPAPKATTLSIEQVIANTKSGPSAPAPAPVAPAVSSSSASLAAGTVSIQLASVPNEAQARTLMADLQQRYASKLGGVSLRIVRADLGSKGTYYRIQSQGLAEADAGRICSAMKQSNAGCILVRK